MKRKTITLVVYMLVCISLVSVGFAAWVITGGTSTNAGGNVTASTVTDSSLSTSQITWSDGSTIHFGAPVDASGNLIENSEENWFQFNGSDKQVLSVTFSFDLKAGSDANSSINASLDDVVTEYDESALADSIGAGYVSAAEFDIKVGTRNKISGVSQTNLGATLLSELENITSNIVNIQITINYKWGTAYGGENPYTFFNSISSGSKLIDIKNTPNDASDDVMAKKFAYDSLKVLEGETADAEFNLVIYFLAPGEEDPTQNA